MATIDLESHFLAATEAAAMQPLHGVERETVKPLMVQR